MVEKEIIAPIGNIDELEKLLMKIFDHPEILDAFPETLYLSGKVPISKVFTEERIRIIKKIKAEPHMTVTKLAESLKRRPQAVSRDLKILSKYNLVELKKEGKEIKSEVKYSWMIYPVAQS